MANHSTKKEESRIPPGVQAQAAMISDPVEIKRDDGRILCRCCGKDADAQEWIALLQMCEFCAFHCDGLPECCRFKCQCPGECSPDHKAGVKCNAKATLVLGRIVDDGRLRENGKFLEVCPACAVEIARAV